MHILLRGDLLQRLRLASGLVLFLFAGTHFLNHALGLVSLEVMHQVQEVRTAVTRSSVGTAILLAALVAHISLGLYKLARRGTLKMPLWEALQISIALAIPFLLLPHIVNTRIAHVFFGVNDTYLYELARLWPDRAVLQSLLLLLVWGHACIGLHYWLRLVERYHVWRPVLWAVAAFVPVLGLSGFAVSGQLTADIMSDPVSLSQLKQQSNWPNVIDGATMAQLRDLTLYGFAALLALIASIYLLRRLRSHAVMINYRDGPTVEAGSGMTLLEVSRHSGVPHASVCGGRARCFTCRVKIERGIDQLPAPNRAESLALRVLQAPVNIRLACQLRPTGPITVTVLNRPSVPGPLQVEFVEITSVVAAHARAVLTQETADIASGAPDAVAGWLDGKLNHPTFVPDLSENNFSLSGARIDYLQDRPVATVSYARDAHAISLFIVPSDDGAALAVRGTHSGYSIIGWADAEYAYLAASDLSRTVLDELQDAYTQANARRRDASAESSAKVSGNAAIADALILLRREYWGGV